MLYGRSRGRLDLYGIYTNRTRMLVVGEMCLCTLLSQAIISALQWALFAIVLGEIPRCVLQASSYVLSKAHATFRYAGAVIFLTSLPYSVAASGVGAIGMDIVVWAFHLGNRSPNDPLSRDASRSFEDRRKERSLFVVAASVVRSVPGSVIW